MLEQVTWEVMWYGLFGNKSAVFTISTRFQIVDVSETREKWEMVFTCDISSIRPVCERNGRRYCTERCSTVASQISCILLPSESTMWTLHLISSPFSFIMTHYRSAKAMHGSYRVLELPLDFKIFWLSFPLCSREWGIRLAHFIVTLW
jgi:hypothetical protein